MLMTYIQYIPQFYRKEKKIVSINHTATISINYTTSAKPVRFSWHLIVDRHTL